MPLSLYFHIPFCKHRCAYCDFNTYAGKEAQIPAYVEALCREIEVVGTSLHGWLKEKKDELPLPGIPAIENNHVHTIFFGGGTPSLLDPSSYDKIFRVVHRYFRLLPEAEISMEANPGTLNLESLQKLRSIGFNRISLGVQSSDPGELRQLERIHTFYDVIDAVAWSRAADFENLNLDLIFGLPEQTLERWLATLERVMALNPEHLSLYALTIEHGTPFGHWTRRGRMPIPDPDQAAQMYEMAAEILAGKGYIQYEISNWAMDASRQGGVNHVNSASRNPDFACRHNLQYWHGDPYLGLGAGAHGYAGGVRYSNALRIKTYIERMAGNGQGLRFPISQASVVQTRIPAHTAMQETMLTGLRLTREGVSAQDFARRHGVEMMDVFGKEVDDLLRLGLLEWLPEGSLVRLTARGRLLGNQVFIRFVGD